MQKKQKPLARFGYFCAVSGVISMALTISVPLILVYALNWDRVALSHQLLALFRYCFWLLISALLVFVVGKELLGFDSYRNKCFEKDIGKVLDTICSDQNVASNKKIWVYLMITSGFVSFIAAGFLMGHGVFHLIIERALQWGV